MPNLKIDPALRDYLKGVPSISDELLEKSLKAEGKALEPITVWKGRDVIVDGHRRYAACERLGLPTPEIRYKSFKDIQEVKDWMDDNQDLRRNRSYLDRAQARTKKVEALVKGGAKRSEAAATVARECGVNERTVYRDQRVTEALQKLPIEVRKAFTSGKVEGSKTDIETLAELPTEHQKQVIKSVNSGEFKTLRGALKGEESTDTVSVTTKPPADLFHDAMKQLGGLKKILDSMKGLGAGRYKAAMELADDLGSELEAWKKEVL